MKRKLTGKRRKRHLSVPTTGNKLTISRILINRIVQIILTVDMTIADTVINTITTVVTKPMNKISRKTTRFVGMKLMPDNIMNVRIKIFKVLIPPNRTLINFRHQLIDIMTNNPAEHEHFLSHTYHIIL